MEMIYRYLTGPRFRHRIEAVVERFTEMQTDLDRERNDGGQDGEDGSCTPCPAPDWRGMHVRAPVHARERGGREAGSSTVRGDSRDPSERGARAGLGVPICAPSCGMPPNSARAPHHFRRPRPEPPSALFLDGLSSCPSSKNKRFGARSDKRKCTQSLHVSSKLLCRG
jgi:hypothetical protein